MSYERFRKCNSLHGLYDSECLEEPKVGTIYSDDVYNYVYGCYYNYSGISLTEGQHGWGVQLKDMVSTAPITKPPLSEIYGWPVVNANFMCYGSKARSIDFTGSKTNLDVEKCFFPNNFGRNLMFAKMMFASSRFSQITLSENFGANIINMDGMFLSANARQITFSEKFGSNAKNMNDMFKYSKVNFFTFPEEFGKKSIKMKNMFHGAQTTKLALPAQFGSCAVTTDNIFKNSKIDTVYISNKEEKERLKYLFSKTRQTKNVDFVIKWTL